MVNLQLKDTDKLELIHNCRESSYPFEFAKPHVVDLPNQEYYVIPRGTKFDFASIPTIVLWLFNKRSQAKRGGGLCRSRLNVY